MEPRGHGDVADLIVLGVPTVLGLDRDDATLEVHAGPGEVGQFVAAQSGVHEGFEDRPEAAVGGFEQAFDLLGAEKAHLLSRRLELLDLAAGVAREVAEGKAAVEHGADRVELGVDGGGLGPALQPVSLVVLDERRRDGAQALGLGEILEVPQDDLVADVGVAALVGLGVLEVFLDEVGEALVLDLEARLAKREPQRPFGAPAASPSTNCDFLRLKVVGGTGFEPVAPVV